MTTRNFEPLSRRYFINVLSTAAVATTGLLVACKKDKDTGNGGDGGDGGDDTGTSYDWDEEVDVLIIGAGGAGLTAAVEALDAGASVLLLEKASEAGGSTVVSGGLVQGSNTPIQAAAGISDTAEAHAEYYTQAGEGVPDPELVELLAGDSADAIAWMESLGHAWTGVYGVGPIATVDPALMVDRIHIPAEYDGASSGAAHVAVLMNAVQTRGGEIRYEATVQSLVQAKSGSVVGVIVDEGGTEKAIKAKRAVVLASGGFDRNLELARAWSPQLLWELETGVSFCALTNTGDGHKMGMEVGAALAGLGGTIGVPGTSIGVSVPGIWVNRHSQRFINEGSHYAYAMRAIFQQQEHVGWAIFDEPVRALGGEVIGGFGGGWSHDLGEEIADGTVLTGPTIAELAEAMGVPVTELQRTVENWNTDVKSLSADPLYGRTAALTAIENPPFYAAKVTSVNLGSQGGLKIDRQARVIDVNGHVIPRLYAAGMVAGGFLGPYYPGSGTAILSTVVFGRIAGRMAAAEEEIEETVAAAI